MLIYFCIAILFTFLKSVWRFLWKYWLSSTKNNCHLCDFTTSNKNGLATDRNCSFGDQKTQILQVEFCYRLKIVLFENRETQVWYTWLYHFLSFRKTIHLNIQKYKCSMWLKLHIKYVHLKIKNNMFDHASTWDSDVRNTNYLFIRITSNQSMNKTLKTLILHLYLMNFDSLQPWEVIWNLVLKYNYFCLIHHLFNFNLLVNEIFTIFILSLVGLSNATYH